MRQTLGTLAAIVSLAVLCSLGSASTLAEPLPGQEEERRLISDRLNISLGAFRPDFTTDVAAGFGGPLGAFINIERELGVDEDLAVFRLDGFYRFKPKHAIDWTFMVLDRDGLTTIDEDFEFGDPPKQFAANAEVASQFNSTLFAANYKYSFVNDGRIDAGVSAGLFFYEYDLQLVGDAEIITDPPQDPPLVAAGETADTRVIAPLPAFGFYIDYAWRKNFVFRASIRGLSLEVGDFTGRFLDSRIGLDWYFYKHFGLGLGFSRTSIDFRDDGSDPFRVDYAYGGYLAYVSIVF